MSFRPNIIYLLLKICRFFAPVYCYKIGTPKIGNMNPKLLSFELSAKTIKTVNNKNFTFFEEIMVVKTQFIKK